MNKVTGSLEVKTLMCNRVRPARPKKITGFSGRSPATVVPRCGTRCWIGTDLGFNDGNRHLLPEKIGKDPEHPKP